MAHNVFDYFAQAFGTPLATVAFEVQAFKDLPLDSPCGEECKHAIDAGKALFNHVCAAFGRRKMAEEAIDITRAIVAFYLFGEISASRRSALSLFLKRIR